MADAPANRSRIVPIMADQQAPTPSPPTDTTPPPPRPKTTTKTKTGRPVSKKAAAAPKRASSRRTTRSQSKALGLDDLNANLETLEARGLYAFDTKGDGNCLYYALSDQMYGDWDHASEIRENLSAHMERNREYFSAFLAVRGGERRSKRAVQRRVMRTPIASPPTPSEIDKAFRGMVTRTATNYVWGGAEEIQAFCQFYKRDIRIYSETNVQDFRASNAPDGERRSFLHLAYINNVHYSSVRNVDGPHEGLPNVSPKEGAGPVVLDLASPWKISCIQQGLGGQYDHDTIVEMLRRCRGDIDRAFANLLDEESSSTSSFASSATSAASSQTSSTTGSVISRLHTQAFSQTPESGILPTTIKPRLISSRSSSRHSTASKRSADDSDGDGCGNSGRKQRGREQKRRILPNVTVGINFGDQEKPDLVSLRLRVNSDAVAEEVHSEQASPGPGEKVKQAKEEQGRKLRPRKPRASVQSETDTSSTLSSETVVKEEE